MNALLKLRPGLFGLLFAAIAVSSFATAIGKSPRPASQDGGTIRAAALPSEQAIEPEQAYTYLQYQIDTDLVNLEQLVRNRAAEHLEQKRTAADLNDRLYDLGQDWQATPEQMVQRLAINRAMQTLADGETAPIKGELTTPTVEDYQNVSATE